MKNIALSINKLIYSVIIVRMPAPVKPNMARSSSKTPAKLPSEAVSVGAMEVII
ncbi:MAG: hypothetical protein IKP62_10005 [Salinivirgaceae bacterium]|nr:hypothetical protein [Salinivirgaceae bacterium]